MEKKKLKALSELKFDSVGEEYIYLFECVSNMLDNPKMLKEQPTIEELREIYANNGAISKKTHNEELSEKYEKNSIYWSDVQEQAIIKFLQETDEIEKNKIFSKYIYKSLKKLIENIIFTYKLFRLDVDIVEIQADCMSFLITKIEKYDHTTGAKAYAYLGTIAKHYLMGEKRISYKMAKTTVDIGESVDEASSKPENNYSIEDMEAIEKDSGLFEEIIQKLEEELKRPKMIPNDKKVAEAIIWIFKNHEMLKVYNKNLIYHLIKERTGLQTKEITYSLSRFKKYYEGFKQDFLKYLD